MAAGLAEPEEEEAPASTFGARSGGLAGLKPGGSRLREVGDAASVAFLQAMESISPGDPEAAFAQLMRKPSFRSRLCVLETRTLPAALLPFPGVSSLAYLSA